MSAPWVKHDETCRLVREGIHSRLGCDCTKGCTCPVEWTGALAPLRGHAPGCPAADTPDPRPVGRDWTVSSREVERYRMTSSRAAQEKGETGS